MLWVESRAYRYLHIKLIMEKKIDSNQIRDILLIWNLGNKVKGINNIHLHSAQVIHKSLRT